jgi:hypothetical protein
VKTTLSTVGRPWSYHKGHLTPIGLYELLEEHPDEILFLDDVGELLGQRIGIQLLLAALGRQQGDGGERVVRYRRQGRDDEVRFSGGIVMVSNLELHDTPVLEALKSRVHILRHEPTEEQVAALIRHIASKGWEKGDATITPRECQEVAGVLVRECSSRVLVRECSSRGMRLDLRLLVDKAYPDYLQWRDGDTETHWMDLVITTLEERLVELRHTPAPRSRSRDERLEEERQVVREIVAAHESREERLAAWRARMGDASERRFYRRPQEVEAEGGGSAA